MNLHAGLIGLVLMMMPLVGAAQSRQGTVVGAVQDAETGAPVEYAQILLDEANRSTVSDALGVFELRFISEGTYTLKAFRIGYEPLSRTVDVSAGDTLRLTLRMASTALEAGEVVVEGARSAALADAAVELEGERLRQHLGSTIAETLDDEPGIAMRSMGPAPARPVLRGLGGERLLVLEDGGRTGDLSSSSTDHAVVIDPMTAERMEVIRGPAALVYGPNALGGVVNVIRDYIPASRPDRVHVQLSTQGQTVNNGLAGGVSASAPVGILAVHADGSFRRGRDVETPEGVLDNTELTTANGSVGASVVRSWGVVGVAGSLYSTQYGIPGGFVGAHPNGVNIEVDRQHVEARAEVATPLRWIPRVEATGSYSRYHHEEFESDGSLGIEFGLLSYHGSLVARTAQRGLLRKGAIGVWAEYRDYAAGGFSFTPASTEQTIAGFLYQDVHVGQFSLQGGARYDVRQVRPTGDAAKRSFGGLSASAAVQWQLHPVLTLSATAMRSLRMPGIEELYSEGPHLAAYSFEIGNEALGRETGYGFEVAAMLTGRRVNGSVAGYLNAIQDYIFPRDTGELNTRVYLPIYQYSGAEARMVGAEGQVSVRMLRRWVANASASYVHGTLTDLNQPIPWMPPLQGKVGIEHERRRLNVGATMRWATSQERLAPFETSTNGYAVFDLFAQYHITAGGMLHTVDVSVLNVGDTAYRDHLSRVKSVMPEAGRNVRLLYRLFF